MDRLEHLTRFYSTLIKVEQKIGGPRRLSDCNGRMDWSERGVYFFRESGENRAETGTGLRVVRVGTHALKRGARTTIWTRLSQHRGPLRTSGGNQRTSIFRSLVGDALIERDRKDYPTWNQRHYGQRRSACGRTSARVRGQRRHPRNAFHLVCYRRRSRPGEC